MTDEEDEREAGDRLGQREAAQLLGVSVSRLNNAVRSGRLEGPIERGPGKGRPARHIRSADLEAWRQTQPDLCAYSVSPAVEVIVIPVWAAAELIGRSKQRLLVAIDSGALRARKLPLKWAGTWYVRVGDLLRWHDLCRRSRRGRIWPSRFNAELLEAIAELALAPDSREESGPAPPK